MPFEPIGGVQAKDAVVTSSEAFESMRIRELEQSRRKRFARRADQIVAVARIGIGHAKVEVGVAERPGEHFELNAFRPNTGPNVADAGPGVGESIRIAVGNVERRAAVDVLDFEIDAVERIQLEVFEVLSEQGDVDVDPRSVIFEPEFESVVEFRIELKVTAAGGGGDGTRDSRTRRRIGDGLPRQGRAVQVEAARLVALGVTGIHQDLVDRLPAQHRRAGEFGFRLLVVEREIAARDMRDDAWQ
jgi:hypothetical protein